MILQGRTAHGGWALELAPWRQVSTTQPRRLAYFLVLDPVALRRHRVRRRIGRVAIRLGRWRLNLEIC